MKNSSTHTQQPNRLVLVLAVVQETSEPISYHSAMTDEQIRENCQEDGLIVHAIVTVYNNSRGVNERLMEMWK